MEQVERYNQIIDDVYKSFLNETIKIEPTEVKERAITQLLNSKESKEDFINKCKTDLDFSQRWGLKIEERELTLEERFNIRYPGGKFSAFQENYPNTHKRNDPNGLLDAFNIPTKLITTKYQNETIESYE